MPVSLLTIIVSNFIIFFAFYTRSLLGFGGALISVPLLAFLFPLKFAVPLEAIFEVLLSILLIRGEWKKIKHSVLWVLLIGSFIGTLIGTFVLKSLANGILLKILGLTIILFSLNLLRHNQKVQTVLFPWPAGLLSGMFAGILGALFGTSGPPIVLYLAYQIKEKHILRATLIGFFTVDFIMRLLIFGLTGLLKMNTFNTASLLIPGLIVSILLGRRHFAIVDDNLYRKGVVMILILSGILLLLK